MLYHFSEDPNIERFVPHVPRTNPTHRPAVWAIDGEHAPLYWFPRDCPRIAVWPLHSGDREAFRSRFETSAWRVQAIESAWFERVLHARIYRYEFDAAPFSPWKEANGQWISTTEVVPSAMTPLGNLVAAHVQAAIELRIVPSLWPLHDVVRGGEFDFSIVRMHNAQPRPSP